MQIPMFCHDCLWEEFRHQQDEDRRLEQAGQPLPDRPPYKVMSHEVYYLVDLDDNNAYVTVCRNKHTIRATLQNLRYEILFESGIVAMLMGFHREAVSSIAAGLERFYEFAIRILTKHAEVGFEIFDEAWKSLNRSELQLGAFQVLYLANFNKPFLNGKKARGEFGKWTQFRNDVTHNGIFPTRTQARDYAKYVYEMIRSTQRELLMLNEAAFHQSVALYMRNGQDEIERRIGPSQPDRDGMYTSATSRLLTTMLDSVVQDGVEDFEGRLSRAKGNLPQWGFRGRT